MHQDLALLAADPGPDHAPAGALGVLRPRQLGIRQLRAAFRTAAVDRVPLGGMGTADEVAAAVVWLLSDEAAYVTWAELDVAGGL